MKLRVTSIQRGCVYDGPGLRTTVFLKGCTMRCPWCCNPETISKEEEYFIDDSKCFLRNGSTSKICGDCERNGGKKEISDCPFGVSEPVSKDYTAEELYDLLSRDFELMQSSGGGVTFSGGEPLLQIDALEPLLVKLKSDGIHIAFETTLTTSDDSIRKAADFANLLIVDLKVQPEHPLYNNDTYIEKLYKRIHHYREKNINLSYRIVYVNSMLAEVGNVVKILEEANINHIELLLCHNLGSNKYHKLNMEGENFSADRNGYDEFSNLLCDRQIIINKLYV